MGSKPETLKGNNIKKGYCLIPEFCERDSEHLGSMKEDNFL
jgi:hypothetical protein